MAGWSAKSNLSPSAVKQRSKSNALLYLSNFLLLFACNELKNNSNTFTCNEVKFLAILAGWSVKSNLSLSAVK